MCRGNRFWTTYDHRVKWGQESTLIQLQSKLNHFSILSLKVSEYPFQQNKHMLKNKTVLLYTYFYNISLNVLRPTFVNTFNLPFLRSQNIDKIRVKVGPKTSSFPPLWAPAPTQLQFSLTFFHWYVANQRTKKTVPRISFFSNIFWIIYF